MNIHSENNSLLLPTLKILLTFSCSLFPLKEMNQQQFRANILSSYGANNLQIEELLAYNHNVFNRNSLKLPFKFPFASEPHIKVWEEYVDVAKVVGAFEALKRVLVQFQFPIQEGISQTQVYRDATRKGVPVNVQTTTGLVLNKPEKLQLTLHQSLAGAIPVLFTPNREDFVSLIQALTMHNEPGTVPASMGACIVAGFNNWDRIRRYRRQWEAKNSDNSEVKWKAEFRAIVPQKQLYQDKFIILSGGCYSNVSATDIGLDELEWRGLSLTIRLEHECTHYLTRRLFNSMRNNLLDELIADYKGIVAAYGHYRADWFLRFMGLESLRYREGGRLQNYRGQPSLSDQAFKILQALVKNAAINLQKFDTQYSDKLRTVNGQTVMLMALTCLTLEELASQEANVRIQNTINELETTLCVQNITELICNS